MRGQKKKKHGNTKMNIVKILMNTLFWIQVEYH